MTASEEVDCDIRGLRYVDIDTHIVAIGPRSFVAQRVLSFAPDPLESLPPSSAPSHRRRSLCLETAALGVTDLSGLIQAALCTMSRQPDRYQPSRAVRPASTLAVST